MRVDLRPKRVILRAELRLKWSYFMFEKADFGPEMADLGLNKADSGPMWAGFGLERANFGPERADLGLERPEFWA